MKKHFLAASVLMALAACGGGEETTKSNSGSATNTENKISITKAILEVKEGDTQSNSIVVTFSGSKNAESAIDVHYSTVNGTAIAGVDFHAASGKVTIPKGARTVDATISTIGNTIHQGTRDFKVMLDDIKTDAGKLEKGLNEALIRINDDDPEPVINFASTKITALEDMGEMAIMVNLDRKSAKETKFKIALSGNASKDADYTISTLDYVIAPMSTEGKVPVKILSDSLIEGTENIELTLSQAQNGTLGEKKTTSLWISGDLKLPDTAVTTYFNNGNILSRAPDSAHPYQDAAYGMDTEAPDNQNGAAGFSYSKIDYSGNQLPHSSNAHTCVLDNHTGLTWEVKSDAPTTSVQHPRKKDALIDVMHPRSQNAVYLWNSPDAKTNGGSVGGINKLEFEAVEVPASSNCSFPTKDEPLYSAEVGQTGCTSDQYVKYINRAAMCGHKDWRLPSINELLTIASYMPGQLTHDPMYISDAATHMWGNPATIRYLSSTPAAENSASVWCLDVDEKRVMLCNKQTYNSLRLVRGRKL